MVINKILSLIFDFNILLLFGQEILNSCFIIISNMLSDYKTIGQIYSFFYSKFQNILRILLNLFEILLLLIEYINNDKSKNKKFDCSFFFNHIYHLLKGFA